MQIGPQIQMTESLLLGLTFILVQIWFRPSEKQPPVARSSTEAEYRSLANTSSEIISIQTLLKELDAAVTVSTIFCDNLSNVALPYNPVFQSHTKHMELDLFFVCEKVINKSLILVHVPAQDQTADILTKALCLCTLLMLLSYTLEIIPLQCVFRFS